MSLRHLATALWLPIAIGAVAAPAYAITKQSAPTNSDGSSRLVDPDARAEQMTDQAQRSDQRVFERNAVSNRNLVAPYGPAAAPVSGLAFPRR